MYYSAWLQSNNNDCVSLLARVYVCTCACVCIFVHVLNVYKVCMRAYRQRYMVFCSQYYRYVCLYVCMHMYVCSRTDTGMYACDHMYVYLYVL